MSNLVRAHLFVRGMGLAALVQVDPGKVVRAAYRTPNNLYPHLSLRWAVQNTYARRYQPRLVVSKRLPTHTRPSAVAATINSTSARSARNVLVNPSVSETGYLHTQQSSPSVYVTYLERQRVRLARWWRCLAHFPPPCAFDARGQGASP